MIFLSSPYSDPDPLIEKTRYLLAMEYTAHILEQGKTIFSPIVHCHEMALRHSLPTDAHFWLRYNMEMLRKASEMHVLTLPNWENSTGVKAELALAKLAFIPTYFIAWG